MGKAFLEAWGPGMVSLYPFYPLLQSDKPEEIQRGRERKWKKEESHLTERGRPCKGKRVWGRAKRETKTGIIL